MEKEYPRRSKLKNEEIEEVFKNIDLTIETEKDHDKKEIEEKRKVGRPEKEIKRKASIVVMVTEEEKERVNKMAKELNINKSTLVRYLLFGEIEKTDFFKNLDSLPIIKELKILNKTLGWVEEI